MVHRKRVVSNLPNTTYIIQSISPTQVEFHLRVDYCTNQGSLLVPQVHCSLQQKKWKTMLMYTIFHTRHKYQQSISQSVQHKHLHPNLVHKPISLGMPPESLLNRNTRHPAVTKLNEKGLVQHQKGKGSKLSIKSIRLTEFCEGTNFLWNTATKIVAV